MRSLDAGARVGAICLAGALGLACAPASHSRAAGAVSPLAVRPVAWNPSNASVGKVSAVADAGDVVAVFSDLGATVFSARAPVATDHAVKAWAGAGAIAGADGAGEAGLWIVGVSAEGRMYHLRGLRTFEDVSDRYGLAGLRVLGATPLGTGYVGFRLGKEIAVADGTHVTRYASGVDGITFDDLAGGAGFGAGVSPDGIEVFDVARQGTTHYPLRGARHVALGPNGRLYAATSRAVYAVDGAGKLALVYDATADTIHGLVASGAAVWFADGSELGVVEGDRVAETSGVKIARDARLAPSASGDVWVLSGGTLDRFARQARQAGAGPEGASPADAEWSASIAPIFARSCSACHLADGVSGTDLSTAPAWEGERAHIRERVVEKRSMPPAGHVLPDEDREAIRRWVDLPSGL